MCVCVCVCVCVCACVYAFGWLLLGVCSQCIARLNLNFFLSFNTFRDRAAALVSHLVCSRHFQNLQAEKYAENCGFEEITDLLAEYAFFSLNSSKIDVCY